MVRLYYTDALPYHYVAARDGMLWVIPCMPASPEVWLRAKPYRGHYTLRPVRPDMLARVYAPA